MNKIIVDQKNLILQDEEVLIEKIQENVNLKIKGNVKCGIKALSNTELTIYLEENSNLLIEFLTELEEDENKIIIYSANHSKLDFHFSCTYKGKNKLLIESYITSSHTETEIKIRSVEEEGTLEILATGIIEKDTKDNCYLEDIKSLTNNNKSIKIMPDLIVKANTIIANHNATISSVDEKELFYLESKGLKKESATTLIKKGFLEGILTLKELKTGGDEDE